MDKHMKVSRKPDSLIRGPGPISITFEGLSLWEAREMIGLMATLERIRPIPRRKAK